MKIVVPVLALALLAPLAGALVPTPAAPVACATDECRINAASAGYDPTVMTLSTGASVVWHSPDVTHVTRDLAVGAATPACFEALGQGGEDAPPVRFDLVGTQLVATIEGVSTPCANAVATPGGAVLPYFCVIHPTMRGALVVTAV